MNKEEKQNQVKQSVSQCRYDWSYDDMTEEELDRYIEMRRCEFRREWLRYISQYEVEEYIF